jgi:hypothetical protein
MSATASVTVAGVPGVEIVYHRSDAGPPMLYSIGHHRQAFDVPAAPMNNNLALAPGPGRQPM